MAFALSLPVLLFHLALLEGKWHLISGADAFLARYHLAAWEKLLFLLCFSVEILIFLVTVAACLRWLLRPILGRRRGAAPLAVAVAGTGYALAVTLQFQVFQYFQDTLSFALLRSFGGGQAGAALAYIRHELTGLLPKILLVMLVALAACTLGVCVRGQLARLGRLSVVRVLSRRRALLVANGIMTAVPLGCLAISLPLDRALHLSMVHRLYATPVGFLSDFDRDGYGWMNPLRDFAPFDPSRHPYALDIPGNGIDEDGVGGDLPAVVWDESPKPWQGGRLLPHNVVLIVIDSARADLLDAGVDGRPAMPFLRDLPGQRVPVFSHNAFTVPAISALFNGAVASGGGERPSLIDRFKAFGYRTAVISGQHEGFGGIAFDTGMHRADVFVDATSFPKELRMHRGTTPAALAIPARVVAERFAEWLGAAGGDRPFFAYMNWQELHFPYAYPRMPKLLIDRPVPRGEIVPGNRAWVYRTYLNAARDVDESLRRVVALLEQTGIARRTLLVVVGDHGEEFFEHGYLGHGTELSYEQNAVLCKLVNAKSDPPQLPIGLSDLGTLIHNALLDSATNALPFRKEVLCFVGPPETPAQIGLAIPGGLMRYDFITNAWERQSRPGAAFSESPAVPRVVHLWESWMYTRATRLAGGMR